MTRAQVLAFLRKFRPGVDFGSLDLVGAFASTGMTREDAGMRLRGLRKAGMVEIVRRVGKTYFYQLTVKGRNR